MTRKIISVIAIIAVIALNAGFPLTATAAQLAAVKDTMSTQAISTTAIHTVTFTENSGKSFTTGDTIVVDFVDLDFTLNAIASWQTSDFSFNDGTARTILAVSSVSGTPPTCSTAGANNVCVTINTSTNTFTIFPTSSGFTPSGTAPTITFTINGTTASGTGTMTNKNADLDNSQFSVTDTGSNTDSGSGALVVETNDVVNITATVSPTLTFSNDDNSVGFGTLSTSAAVYANGAASGSGSDTVAHTLTIGTNAATGYTLTYNGATLTNGSFTIPVATITSDADGTPGTSQFAMDVVVTGTGTVATGYEHATPNWKFVAGSAQTLASASGPLSSTDSVAVHYLANIAANQQPGSYSANETFVLSGNF